MIHRFYGNPQIFNCVVNCFQNTTLVDDSQDGALAYGRINSCELLSEYYFSR